MNARGPAARAAVFIIQLYRNTVSPLRPPTCRFTPTCSQYAVDAFTTFGAARGSWLSVRRLLKCGPWHSGGWDPIPDQDTDCVQNETDAAERGRGAAENSISTVQQGESQTRV